MMKKNLLLLFLKGALAGLLAFSTSIASATTVSILSPSAGSIVSGNVTITGTSSLASVGNVGVAIDGSSVFSTATGKSSWNFAWDTTGLANGDHTVTVRARTGLADPAPGLQTITLNVQNLSPGGIVPAYNTGGTRINVASGGIVRSALAAVGGTAPYSWEVVGGTLPPGITLNSSGSFSGTSIAVGVHSFTLAATDSLGVSGERDFTIIVNAANLAGTVQAVAIPGTGLTFSLYLPPGYEGGQARYPVVCHLHGINGSHDNEQTVFVPASHEAAVSAGLIEPCIIVFPDGYSDSFWADAIHVEKPAESDVMEKILPFVDANYRTVADRGRRVIQGFSMGGFGAGKFATKFPDAFVACVIYDGAMLNWAQVQARHPAQAHDVFDDSEDNYNLYSPYHWLVQNAATLRLTMPFRDAVGQLRSENANWHSALLGQLVAPDYVETGLDHDIGQLLDAQGANSWEFLAEAFAAASVPATLGFTVDSYSVNENGGEATVWVSRSGNVLGTVGVEYVADSPGGSGWASAGEDFIAVSGALSWGNGETGAKSFLIPIGNDAAREGTESVSLTLSNFSGGAVGGISSATLGLVDDDPDFLLEVNGGGVVVKGFSGSEVQASLEASGGVGPYEWRIVGGSLPPGVTLTGDGVLSGIPIGEGEYAFTVEAEDANGNSDTQSFAFSVGEEINHRPMVSFIADVRVEPGKSVPVREFQVDDVETEAGLLVLGVKSSNQSLLPDGQISTTNSDGNCTVRLVPLGGQTGIATVTITVTDSSGKSTARAFTVNVATVNTGNEAPLIGGVANQVVVKDSSTEELYLTVGDAETAFESLVFSASSSNEELVPNSSLHLVLGGTNASRSVMILPAAGQTGRSTITLNVSDGVNVSATAFVLDVEEKGTPPVISGLPGHRIIGAGATVSGVNFSVGDGETPVENLALVVDSSNPELVPVESVSIVGSGPERTLSAVPVAGGHGAAVIGVSVVDTEGMLARAEMIVGVFEEASSNQGIPQPGGLYVLDSGAGKQVNGISMRDANVRDYPHVDGYVLRTDWGVLEPEDGVTDFTIIDNIFSKLPANQKLSLIVSGVPDWLVALPGITTWTAGTPAVTKPLPWDLLMQERLRRLLEALGSHTVGGVPLRDSSRLAAINVSVPGLKSGIRDPEEIKIRDMPGYSRAAMEAALLTHLAHVTGNFPKVPVQIGFWTYNDSTANPAAWEELRQAILAQHNGVTKPRVGFWMENLAANRAAAEDPAWSGLPNTSFAGALFESQGEAFSGFQMLSSWGRPFNSAHVDNDLNGSPEDGMDYAFNTFQSRYFEVYQFDVDFDKFDAEFQRWHDFLDEWAGLPVFVSAVSRKSQGGKGTFDLALEISSGAETTECRSGGAGGSYTIVFSFDRTVFSGTASVISGTGTVTGSPVFDPEKGMVAVDLTGVSSGQKITVRLSDLNGIVGRNVEISLRILVGDTTGDRRVNIADIAQTQSRSGQVVGAANFRSDVNGDGLINIADIALVQSRSGGTVP